MKRWDFPNKKPQRHGQWETSPGAGTELGFTCSVWPQRKEISSSADTCWPTSGILQKLQKHHYYQYFLSQPGRLSQAFLPP